MNGISQYLEDQHALLELRLAALERAVRARASRLAGIAPRAGFMKRNAPRRTRSGC